MLPIFDKWLKSKSRLITSQNFYLCKKRLDSTEVLRAFLPDWLFDYFDIVQLDNQDARLDIYLDERKVIPLEYKDQPISAYGFTGAYTVQDFPIRGKEVYLHLRRRKWLLLESREIVSCQYNIAYEGTKLTADFVAFLKATN